jgi:hypothetical protein
MVNDTQCMKRRLLYAASQTYRPAMAIAGRTLNWLEPPMVVRRELPGHGRALDLALVGRVPEGVVIAFRGALPPLFDIDDEDDWNALLDSVDDNAACIEDADFEGGVHAGFATSLKRLWTNLPSAPGVHALVQTLLERSRRDGMARPHLFVTGHSRGGAIANLFAMRAARAVEWRALPISVMTIGAPKCGDSRFAIAYATSRIACLRYEVASDPVPQLPAGIGAGQHRLMHRLVEAFAPALRATDWQPVGEVMSGIEDAMLHLPWAGSRRTPDRTLGKRGIGLVALPGLPVAEAIRAHALCPGGGYDRLVCSGEGACDHGAGAAARGVGMAA